MKFDRRQLGQLALGAGLATAWARPGLARSGDVTRSHGSSLMGSLNYGEGFAHYEYVNPDAPKGGSVRLAAVGAYDSFNPFIVKGNPAAGFNIFGGIIYDALMDAPLDQPSTEYGLLAEWMEWPSDYSWVTFKLREDARWHDGRPVTAADAVHTFKLLTEFGRPLYRLYYQNVETAEDLGDGMLKFTFDQTNNRELPQIMGQLPVLPRHIWEDADFTRSSLDIPLGSGPYRVGKYEPNRFIEFERVEDYWGADLPVKLGQNNFDTLRFEYFKDPNAAFEAFKSGSVDFRAENSSLNWGTRYDFPAFKRGEVVKEEIALGGPQAVQSFAFNLRRPIFQDRRVREALSLAFDFEWTNEAIFFGSYARPTSYFQGTPDLMSSGLPEGAELALLEPYRDRLDPRVFTEPFAYPKSDGSGRPDRRRLRESKKLLEEAGLSIENGKLLTPEGEPFTFEFLIGSSAQERVIGPFIKNLERLGVDASIRLVDASQYAGRYQSFDFDMVIGRVSNSSSPGNEQRDDWGSGAADRAGSDNLNGVADPVVDALIEKIIYAEDREGLAAASRALDRVLLWGNYNILQLYTPTERIAYWKDRVEHPENMPDLSVGFPTIWWAKGLKT